MSLIVYLFLFLLVVGLVGVASNPSPYFGALGLVVVAGAGCGILVGHGGSFLSLVLFLIYLGGMLVVFAYSAALAAEPYPECWGSWPVLCYSLLYLGGVFLVSGYFQGGWYEASWVEVGESEVFSVLLGELGGVVLLYSMGGGMLMTSAYALLLTLLVVLEVVRGPSRGAVRAV